MQKAMPENASKVQATPGKGIEGMVNGRTIRSGNRRLFFDHGITALPDEVLTRFEAAGKTTVIVGENDKVMGSIAIADTIKEDAISTVRQLKDMGIEIWMLTGDNERTVNAVAKEVGIENVIAGVLPADKASMVEEVRRRGLRVAMVGDGINDAPALAAADVGIAMGTGADVAIEAADIALMKADTQGVVKAIRLSFWAFIYNLIGIGLAAFGIISPVISGAAMALSSVGVISNSLLLKRVGLEKAARLHKVGGRDETIGGVVA